MNRGPSGIKFQKYRALRANFGVSNVKFERVQWDFVGGAAEMEWDEELILDAVPG